MAYGSKKRFVCQNGCPEAFQYRIGVGVEFLTLTRFDSTRCRAVLTLNQPLCLPPLVQRMNALNHSSIYYPIGAGVELPTHSPTHPPTKADPSESMYCCPW